MHIGLACPMFDSGGGDFVFHILVGHTGILVKECDDVVM